MPTTQDFSDRLQIELEKAGKRGDSHVVVKAGDLHRLVGGYPHPSGNHRMPECCFAMRKEAEKYDSDEVLDEPRSGQGASLKIRYKLPR